MAAEQEQLAGSNMSSGNTGNYPIAGVTNITNFAAQLYEGWRNREFQREINEIMRRDAWDRWRANNEYNLPVNQVQRLKDAGFNPHLLNGSPVDAGSSDSASETPALAGSNQVAPYMDPLAMAQAENLRAQTEAIEHQTQREDEKQPVTIEQMQSVTLELKKSIERMDEQISLLTKEKKGKELDNEMKEYQNMVYAATMNDTVAMTHLKAHMMQDEQTYFLANLLLDMGVKSAGIKQAVANAALSYAQMRNMDNLLELSKLVYTRDTVVQVLDLWMRNKLTDSQVELNNEQKRAIELANNLKEKYGEAEVVIGLILGGFKAANEGVDLWHNINGNPSISISEKNGLSFGMGSR